MPSITTGKIFVAMFTLVRPQSCVVVNCMARVGSFLAVPAVEESEEREGRRGFVASPRQVFVG